jgi:hypothetical protein
VKANSTGGQGSRRAVAPSDDDDDEIAFLLYLLYQVRIEYIKFQFHVNQELNFMSEFTYCFKKFETN